MSAPPRPNKVWTPERLDELRKHAQTGIVAREIAAKMGMTRNQIIGAMHRNGIRSAIPDGTNPNTFRYDTFNKRIYKPKSKPLPPLEPDEPALSERAPDWGLCQWPQPDGFCGKPALFGDGKRFPLGRKPYCYNHSRRAYQAKEIKE